MKTVLAVIFGVVLTVGVITGFQSRPLPCAQAQDKGVEETSVETLIRRGPEIVARFENLKKSPPTVETSVEEIAERCTAIKEYRQHALAARAWARSRLREKEMAQIREELDYLSIGAEVHTTETGWVVWDFRILECPVRMMYSPGRQLLLTTTRVAPETPEEMKFLWQAIEICETDADDVGVRRWLEQKYGLQQFGVVVNLTTPNIIAAFSEAMTTLEKYCGAFFLQSFDDRDA